MSQSSQLTFFLLRYKTLGMGSVLASSQVLYWFIFIISLVLLFPLVYYKDKYPRNMIIYAFW